MVEAEATIVLGATVVGDHDPVCDLLVGLREVLQIVLESF